MAKGNTGLIIGGAALIIGAAVLSSDSPRQDDYLPPGPGPGPGPGGNGMPSWMVDRRDDADQDTLYGSGNHVIDPIGVTLHQMGLSRTTSEGSQPDRLLRVHAHFVVMRDGRVLWLFDPDQRIANSQYNRTHVQIEVEGNFQSKRGRWHSGDTFGRHNLNPEQVVALRRLLVWLEQRMGRNENGKLELTGHSMAASPSRRGNDPGPEVWQAAAWVLDRPVWEMGPVLSEHNGVPIDDAWWTYEAVSVPGVA